MFYIQRYTFYVYAFIHDALSDYTVLCGGTDVAAADIRILSNEMSEIVERDGNYWFSKAIPGISIRGLVVGSYGYVWFCQLLERVSSQYQASYQEAKAQYNVQKNRFPDKLVSFCTFRMVLCALPLDVALCLPSLSLCHISICHPLLMCSL